MKHIVTATFTLILTLGFAGAQTTIEFWHAFGDAARSGWIEARAAEWSEQNPDYNVVVESKASYRENAGWRGLSSAAGRTAPYRAGFRSRFAERFRLRAF